MLIGYCRVSKLEQNLDRQTDALYQAGAERIFQEKMTGAKADRPELIRMLDTLRAGDTVIVSDLSRLGRSTLDLLELVNRFHAAGVTLLSLKESFDTRTASGRAMMEISMTLAQLERDLLRERTTEGLAAARARGRMGGRPRIDTAKVKDALTMMDSGKYTVKEVTKRTGVSAASVYRYLRARNV